MCRFEKLSGETFRQFPDILIWKVFPEQEGGEKGEALVKKNFEYYHTAQIEIERVSIFISRLEHILLLALLLGLLFQMRHIMWEGEDYVWMMKIGKYANEG